MIGENLLRPEPTLLPSDDAVVEALEGGADPESLVREYPESTLVWALLADTAESEGREIEAYAFARVGYHRGLDALRKAGWRGDGPVPWSHAPNRGVLRSLHALLLAAKRFGEHGEVERLAEFLQGADPTAIHAIETEK